MLRFALALLLVTGVSAPSWAQDITYRKHIRPLWTQKCAACHGVDAPYLGEFMENQKKFEAALKGPRMDSYADLIAFIGWPDTGAIMRRLDDGKNTAERKPGNMYQYLGATDTERQKNLALFKEWVGKDAWKLNRWEARGKVPAITKADLDRIQVKY
ncbi:MAG: cytochrome C [Burkholderiales bacterium]|nr:cytochrome C [Burkholderiales bacterium]